MKKIKVVLASKSTRRRELLHNIFDEFEIITRDTDESFPEAVHPRDAVEIFSIPLAVFVAEKTYPNLFIVLVLGLYFG